MTCNGFWLFFLENLRLRGFKAQFRLTMAKPQTRQEDAHASPPSKQQEVTDADAEGRELTPSKIAKLWLEAIDVGLKDGAFNVRCYSSPLGPADSHPGKRLRGGRGNKQLIQSDDEAPPQVICPLCVSAAALRSFNFCLRTLLTTVAGRRGVGLRFIFPRGSSLQRVMLA